jgi:hypothetical protein
MASSKSLREPSFQELSQLRRGPELRDGVQFLECRSKRIRKTPDRPGPEFLILRLEVEVMDCARQVLWSLEFPLNECFVDDYLRRDIGEFASLPRFDLLTHGLEVSLHPVDADGNAIN